MSKIKVKQTNSKRTSAGRKGVPSAFPSMVAMADGSCFLSGAEPIGEVEITSTGFQIPINARIQPADPSTFNWLAPIAARFEKYRFRYLRVRFYPGVSTMVGGQMALCFDYDVRDALPSSYPQALQYYSKATSPYSPCTWNIKLRDNKWLYTTDLVPSGTDPKTYDYGRLFVATYGLPYTGTPITAGFINIEYGIEFQSRNPGSGYTSQITFSKLSTYRNGSDITLSSTDTTIPVSTKIAGDDLVTYNASGRFKFNEPGLYLVSVAVKYMIASAAGGTYTVRLGYATSDAAPTQFVSGQSAAVITTGAGADNTSQNGCSFTGTIYVADPSDLNKWWSARTLISGGSGTRQILTGDCEFSIVKIY